MCDIEFKACRIQAIFIAKWNIGNGKVLTALHCVDDIFVEKVESTVLFSNAEVQKFVSTIAEIAVFDIVLVKIEGYVLAALLGHSLYIYRVNIIH